MRGNTTLIRAARGPSRQTCRRCLMMFRIACKLLRECRFHATITTLCGKPVLGFSHIQNKLMIFAIDQTFDEKGKNSIVKHGRHVCVRTGPARTCSAWACCSPSWWCGASSPCGPSCTGTPARGDHTRTAYNKGGGAVSQMFFILSPTSILCKLTWLLQARNLLNVIQRSVELSLQLMYPTDSFGNICGRGEFSAKPLLLFFDLTKCASLTALAGCPTPQVTVSTQYLHYICIYTISTQYLHNIYTVSTQYPHHAGLRSGVSSAQLHYLHNIYTTFI